MGYTHYFETKNDMNQKRWNEVFIPGVKRIIACAEKKGIKLCGPLGEFNTVPEYTNNRITFNGDENEAHETMSIERKRNDFYFCKTAQKPYDEVVVAVILFTAIVFPSAFSWSSDGDSENGDFDTGRALPYKVFDTDDMISENVHNYLKAMEATA